MAEKEVKGIKKFFEEFKAFAMRGNVKVCKTQITGENRHEKVFC